MESLSFHKPNPEKIDEHVAPLSEEPIETYFSRPIKEVQKELDFEPKKTTRRIGGKRKTKKMRNRRKMQKKHKKTNKK
jgi:hypothetical protein